MKERNSFQLSDFFSLPTEASLLEGDCHPPFFAPDDMTGLSQLLGLYNQREAIWKEERAHHFERSACF